MAAQPAPHPKGTRYPRTRVAEGGKKENPTWSARQSSLEPKWPGRPSADIDGLIAPTQHNHHMNINDMLTLWYSTGKGYCHAVHGC